MTKAVSSYPLDGRGGRPRRNLIVTRRAEHEADLRSLEDAGHHNAHASKRQSAPWVNESRYADD